MQYEIFGGFEVPRTEKKNCVDTAEKKAFWHSVEEHAEGLASALGCYVFAMRAGKGARPWYVGKTCRQGFSRECFESHKLVYYNEVISGQNGTPLMYFVARMTPGGRFSSVAPQSEVEFLENFLIGAALQVNESLKNRAQTKFLQEMHVPGLINPRRGTPPHHVSEFKRLFHL